MKLSWNNHRIRIHKKKTYRRKFTQNDWKCVEKTQNNRSYLILITDNVSNNTTFFYCLMKNISNITKCVNIIFENDDEDSKNNEIDLIHVFCLTHVLQLTLQTFLNFVRINSINDELQKNWYEQKNINVIKRANKDLSMILTKIIVILSNFNLLNVIRFS